MSNTHQTILASRPAAMVLALTLAAGLTAPFLILPHAQVAVAATAPATLPCAENNHNGCTELSPTPPEDTVAVPPNIVLMLDDSGSMAWDIMPDACFVNGVKCTSAKNLTVTTVDHDALINSANNGVYYNPTVTYTPPPKADGSSYPAASFSAALVDGFNSASHSIDISQYDGGDDSSYNKPTDDYLQYSKQFYTNAYDASDCPADTLKSGTYYGYCYFNPWTNQPYDKIAVSNGQTYHYIYRCNNVSDVFRKKIGEPGKPTSYTCISGLIASFFTYTTGDVGGAYTLHYVAKDAADCTAASLSTTECTADETVKQNVANWFSYYHTRILMAKSGLMTAFDKLSPVYRFGFGSINGKNDSKLPSPKGTFGSSQLAEVQPFGDGSTGTQKAAFWNWIKTMKPANTTPLRQALQSVGTYYQDDQPWQTMSSDPGYTKGSTTKFACRASYTILTTDGFWNGSDPTGINNGGNADGADGPTFTPPAGKTYTVTGYVAAAPYSDNQSNTLADVAMYYWENDLQPSILNEVAPSTSDPAFWQHMTTFTMGLGFAPTYISPTGTTIPQIFAWAQGGTAIPGFSWPTPSSDNIRNIADLAHAAVNGHGDFFSVKSPQELANGFSKAIADINGRVVLPTSAAVNASVLSAGALSFVTGYSTSDWSGTFDAVALNSDGSVGASGTGWTTGAGTLLNNAYHSATGYSGRTVFTLAYDSTQSTPITSFPFNAAKLGSLDSTETAGLTTPALTGGTDTLAERIDYLLGSSKYEGTTSPAYRTRTSILGAIIHSEPVYVAGASGNYYSTWPTTINGVTVSAPENGATAQSYDAFVSQESTRAGMVYVGANDGMLHAFDAPAPTSCTTHDVAGNCIKYGFGSGTPGVEAWAFVPRAVYANLGNLTNVTNFAYLPTVDGTPVTRDVFFSQKGDHEWHTILTGGVGLGGRGVYALDITHPTSFSASDVLWEFDSDMAIPTGTCTSITGTSVDGAGCRASDLGYTVSQPNVGRLATGNWVVLVPNGYFPDCGTPDMPTNDVTNCQAIAAQAPKSAVTGNPYSALFVLDAQTGSVIAELKTPDIAGVTSFGLAAPVMGDYQNDQVDDVAFAGDVQGNLWRFDLSDPSAANWKVTLVYQGGTAVDPNTGLKVVQPITSMPHLFPDPSTNRFVVTFGTGKFLGVGDNSSRDVQAIYGVRDPGYPASTAPYTQGDLTPQYLHETTVPTGQPNAGASLRCVTGNVNDTCTSSPTSPTSPTPINQIPASSGGWFINLQTTTSGGVVNDVGERVVVTPGAIFASNTVIFETLITGANGSNPCSPSTQGAILALNATTGGPAGVSSLGGGPMVGGRISNARTSGSLPVVSALGGGQAYLPGVTLAPAGTSTLSVDAPIWRRRSWNGIIQNQ